MPANLKTPAPDKPETKAPEVVESTTPQVQQQVDVTQLTPEQLMAAAALAEERRQEEMAKQDEEAMRQYLASPQGQLEMKLQRSLPRFKPTSIQENAARGGFYNSQFDIEGLAASLQHCWVPIEDLHQWRRWWRPIDPMDVTMFEGEVQQGKVFVRSFDIKGNLVVYRDMVLMVADRETIEAKTAHGINDYNERFRRRAPDGRSTQILPTEQGRSLTVQSESFGFDSNRIPDTSAL